MKEALKKINELAGVLEQRIAFNGRVAKENDHRASELNKLEDTLNAKSLDLDLREKKIAPAEKAASVMAEAIALKHEADVLMAETKQIRDAQNKAISEAQKKLTEDARNLSIALEKVKRDNDLLAKEWAEVRKEKEGYKVALLKELMGKTIAEK